jgi:hypothetical protein
VGVYHLMGLGRSVGAVTGPISYLAHRYQRWSAEDQAFFFGSGEVVQRSRGEKVGDVEALVLFTTREVITAKDERGSDLFCFEYYANKPGARGGFRKEPRPMRKALREELRNIWPGINDRRYGTIYWCEVDRRSLLAAYERIAKVVIALASSGGQGKEQWANLTSGNNVLNLALQLAANISGEVARLYYVQAPDQESEQCACFTEPEGYWVDIPAMPLALRDIQWDILVLLQEKSPLPADVIYSTLQSSGRHWEELAQMQLPEFLDLCLDPLWKQRLVEGNKDAYRLGRQWPAVRPFREILAQARSERLVIDELCERYDWIAKEELELR